MSETSSQTPPATGITPDITADRLKKVGNSVPYEEPDRVPPEEFVVRLRKNQTSVAFTLNTKRMVERREIARENDAIRRSGR